VVHAVVWNSDNAAIHGPRGTAAVARILTALPFCTDLLEDLVKFDIS
jgi:hypothetical protein